MTAGNHPVATGLVSTVVNTVLTGPHQILGRLQITLGIDTEVTSSRRSKRDKCKASRESVFTRSPADLCSFDGATTSHRIPAAVYDRYNPKPVSVAMKKSPLVAKWRSPLVAR
jgi:hypothetical protein